MSIKDHTNCIHFRFPDTGNHFDSRPTVSRKVKVPQGQMNVTAFLYNEEK